MLAHNESTADRIIRLAIGVLVLSLLFVGPKTPWALLGLIPLITAFVGFCPVYRLFGINTCRTERTPARHGT